MAEQDIDGEPDERRSERTSSGSLMVRSSERALSWKAERRLSSGESESPELLERV